MTWVHPGVQGGARASGAGGPRGAVAMSPVRSARLFEGIGGGASRGEGHGGAEGPGELGQGRVQGRPPGPLGVVGQAGGDVKGKQEELPPQSVCDGGTARGQGRADECGRHR